MKFSQLATFLKTRVRKYRNQAESANARISGW